ncbi:MAG: aminoacyl-tRNA hydrolase [Candidatus Brocadiia bacterium]
MKIIVGIGNPGKEYAETRHNAGFMVVDRLAREHGIGPWRSRFHSRTAEGSVRGVKVLLMKPETFVNESGRAVRAAVDWCRVETPDVMVVCDDFNLALGRLRVRPQGRSAGHHGLDSILAALGAEPPRLRIGIGTEQGGRGRDFVLSTFSTGERPVLDEAVQRAVRALEVWLESGMARCQNEFNAGPDANKDPGV